VGVTLWGVRARGVGWKEPGSNNTQGYLLKSYPGVVGWARRLFGSDFPVNMSGRVSEEM